MTDDHPFLIEPRSPHLSFHEVRAPNLSARKSQRPINWSVVGMSSLGFRHLYKNSQ